MNKLIPNVQSEKNVPLKNINDNNLLPTLVFPNIFLISEDRENLFLNKSFQTI